MKTIAVAAGLLLGVAGAVWATWSPGVPRAVRGASAGPVVQAVPKPQPVANVAAPNQLAGFAAPGFSDVIWVRTPNSLKSYPLGGCPTLNSWGVPGSGSKVFNGDGTVTVYWDTEDELIDPALLAARAAGAPARQAAFDQAVWGMNHGGR